ncbi:MAG TPA: hypothetical protein VJR02_14390 [Pyrinomonadaceae bacterium]|nr:hypothetical protein [Pyrinomonadaceae bacterium]
MVKLICAALIIASSIAIVSAQQNKPWSEWTKKDVEKTLNDSPWAQTQTDTDTSEMTYSPTISQTTTARREDTRITEASRVESGAKNSAMSVKYRIRLLSAKPIREAFARMVLSAQQNPAPDFAQQLQGFVDRDFSEYVVVAVSVEASDQRYGAPIAQAFSSATADILKNNTYLERKDGKRLFLMDYRPPANDGMGAKFVFARSVDGKAFIGEGDIVRFVSEFNEKVKLNARYKISDMTYNGKLEY